MKPNPKAEPVLCFVKGGRAYFTTRELSKQWGEDWRKAPYEHNAGLPNTPYENEEDQWEIIEVLFESPLVDPGERAYCNSVYSVEDINAGAVAWLSTPTWSSDPKIAIPAGTTIPEFKRLIRQAGGKIFVEEKE